MICCHSSSKNILSPQQALGLANVCLASARATDDLEVAQELCLDAKSALSCTKRALPTFLATCNRTEETMRAQTVSAAYSSLGELQDSLGQSNKARTSYKNAERWRRRGHVQPSQSTSDTRKTLSACHFSLSQSRREQGIDATQVPRRIFPEDIRLPTTASKLPKPDERLRGIPELAYCLGLLQSTDNEQGAATRDWLQATLKNTDERERLMALATDVVREFKHDNRKDPAAITEVLHLVPVLEKDAFRYLLMEFYSGIDQSDLLDLHQLEGIARLIQGAKSGYLNSDDLAKLLELLRPRLKDNHDQSPHYMYQLTTTLSHVLDAMADTSVCSLDREKLHEPFMGHLDKLRKSSDPEMVFQAAYVHQALQHVPDNKTPWHGTLLRAGKVSQGLSGLMGAMKGVDLSGFFDGLKSTQHGFSGLTEDAQLVKAAHKDVTLLVEGREDFVDAMKEGLCSDRKREWYTALRGADVFIQKGQFAKFERLVYEAPCRREPAFQWGVCLKLAEIAGNNSMWDKVTQRSAVMFLGEIYRNDIVWGQQSSVKQWIINILLQLSSQTGSVAQDAEVLLQELEMDGDAKKQKLYRECREQASGLHQLGFGTPALPTWRILDRVQNKPDVEQSLRQLRIRRINKRTDSIYVQPMAKPSLQDTDESQLPLEDRADEFLSSDQTVLLLLGDSGGGKSTFNHALEVDLWQSYNKKTGVIPLYINLPSIDRPDQDLVAKQLRKLGFTEPHIRELRNRRFVLICDGYDEIQQTHNLYTSNRLNEEGEWIAKMVISCRSECIGSDYRDRFEPRDHNQTGQSSLFQEAVIMPFSTGQIKRYIRQYVDLRRPPWEAPDYLKALDKIPGLLDLVKNPFLLAMTLEVLPRMVDPDEHMSAICVNKVALYDHFVEQWLERSKRGFEQKNLSFQLQSAFDSLCDDGFIMNGIDFLTKLCVAIYKEQNGQPVVEYSCSNDEDTWKAAFFSRNEETQLLLEACPLVRNDNQYRFIHRSILEYGLARAIYGAREREEEKPKSEPNLSRRGSMSSVWSFEIEEDYEDTSTADGQRPADSDSPIVWRNLVNDPSVMKFLSDRVELEPEFKQRLLGYIELSKKDKKWRTAAANAITVLVRAGVKFIDKDLRGIQIPGADLSHGMFDSAQFQDADLRNVNFQGAWLRQTDLSRAQMADVQFGELPFLKEDSEVSSCAYSPDGMSFVTGIEGGVIHVYSTSSLERIRTLRGHRETIRCVAYSPRGDQVASSSDDMTVRLWSMKTGLCQHTLTGHDDWVRGVAYSPQGDTVASASDDKTIRLWDAFTGEHLETLNGHKEEVECVAYSPKGNQIASGSEDSTVRIWDVETGDPIHDMSGHDGSINEVAYSPQGDVVASGSSDFTVRLWDVETGACRHVLDGLLGGTVNGIAYSPCGSQLASAFDDATVRLWDVESGACLQTLTGHNGSVTCVAYSPTSDQFISGSADGVVQLWNVPTGPCQTSFNGHTKGVVAVKVSSKGDMIVTGGMDRTAKVWDANTGKCRLILDDHIDSITAVSFSPQGDRIATGGGEVVWIWDLERGRLQGMFTGHSECINGLAYSPQGDEMVSASDDWTIHLWDVSTGEYLEALQGHTKEVMSVAYSPDGTKIASGGKDRTVRLWNLTEEIYCLQVFKGHRDWVWEVAFSPRGHQIASASGDKTVKLWDIKTGKCLSTLTGHNDRVSCVTYSVKGDLLASGCQDKTVRLWDVATGQCRAVVENFAGGIRGIALSEAHGVAYMVTAGTDGLVLAWDILEEGTLCRVRPRWSSDNRLTATGASIQGVSGLSAFNKQLLRGRGAKGRPATLR